MGQVKIIRFTIKGKMAFFRKYYSNKNALSYLIPPRTAIVGLIASILEMPRNSYYKDFSSENLKVSLEIRSPLKTLTTSINHLSAKKGNGRRQVAHTLVLPVETDILYDVYLKFNPNNKYEQRLIKKLENNDMGYGIYFGQRQFLANIVDYEIIESYNEHEKIKCCLNSIVNKSNIEMIDNDFNKVIVKDLMPLNFIKTNSNRESKAIGEILFEQNGAGINGEFKNVIELNDKYISFFS